MFHLKDLGYTTCCLSFVINCFILNKDHKMPTDLRVMEEVQYDNSSTNYPN